MDEVEEGFIMGSTCKAVSITSHRCRLAAVMLQGDLRPYDSTPLFKARVDRLIDELLQSAGAPQSPNSWDALADRVAARFAHRLPALHRSEPAPVSHAIREEGAVPQVILFSFC